MRRFTRPLLCGLILCSLLIIAPARADAPVSSIPNLAACKELGFSTEEDFLTQGPVPSDGNRIISDGDLLGPNHAVCARNRELLAPWQVQPDLGLDAVDVIDIETSLVAFSTELDDPAGRFTAGDLLATNGTIIPNKVLLTKFQVSRDMGLDGLQFIGPIQGIIGFLNRAAAITRDEWLASPGRLFDLLGTFKVDIWISTESTQLTASTLSILDGDLLSVGAGAIVVKQADLLPAITPAGIPARGVDFGLDAVAASRTGDITTIRLSTEILYRGEKAFTDGDILVKGDGIQYTNTTLVTPFEPRARFLGLDALHMNLTPSQLRPNDYLPYILK